jgi:hypothetical protein
MIEEKSIVISQQNGALLAPAADTQTMLLVYQAKKDFIGAALNEGLDYGPIPGSDKPALKKPGAEKLAHFFGLCPIFEDVVTVEDWTGKDHDGEPFFYYRQKCKLFSGDKLKGSADGSCNSWEKKYRYRWVQEPEVPAHLDKSKLKTRGGKTSEFAFAIDKAETTGKYGKPAEYWKRFTDAIANGTARAIKRKTSSNKEMDAWEIDATLYCIPNDDVAEQVNTILKMAQKRALVAAVLIVTGASDYFTQDIDDYIDNSSEVIEGTFRTDPVTTTTTTQKTNGAQHPETTTEQPVTKTTAAAAPTTNGKATRPLPPATLKTMLEEKAKRNGAKAASGTQKGEIIKGIEEYFATNDAKQRRKVVQKWLTGFDSLDDMPGNVALALYDWLKPRIVDGQVKIDDDAGKELLNVWEQADADSIPF